MNNFERLKQLNIDKMSEFIAKLLMFYNAPNIPTIQEIKEVLLEEIG